MVKLKQLVLIFMEDTSFVKQERFESVDFLHVTKVRNVIDISSSFINVKIRIVKPAEFKDSSKDV